MFGIALSNFVMTRKFSFGLQNSLQSYLSLFIACVIFYIKCFKIIISGVGGSHWK